MNYAVIKSFDIANGPGVRVSLFVSGCRHKCKNCFNSEAWDFGYGHPFTEDTLKEITDSLNKSYIEGFSLLGGEPFEPENQPEVCKILKHIKENFPENIDVLVDGKFVEELNSPDLLFRGSSNQRIIDVKTSLKQGKAVWLPGVWQRKMGSGNIYE